MTQEQYQKAEIIQKQLHMLDQALCELKGVYGINIKLEVSASKASLNKLFCDGLGWELFHAKLKEFKKALGDAIEAKTAELQQEFEKL